MKDKDKNSLMYIATSVVVIIVYVVVYLFGVAIKRDIYKESEYEHNMTKQPINSIMCQEIKIFFEYEYDESNYIDLNNQYPTKDEDGKNFVGDKYTQDFKLKFNEKARGIRYTITAQKLVESDLEEEWVKAYLTSDKKEIVNCLRPDGKVKTLNEYTNYHNKPNEKILYEGVVSQQEARRGYKNFTYRMWINEDVRDQDEDYTVKTIKVKINVYAKEY